MKKIISNFWGNTNIEHRASSNTSPVWNYTQTLLKGVGILAIGGVAYTFFRSLTTSAATSDENALVTANKKSDTTASQISAAPHSIGQYVVAQSSQANFGASYFSKREIVPVTSEFLVNNYTANAQDSPAIAALSNGDFVITWAQVSSTSGSDVYAQRFASNGIFLGSEFLVNTYTIGEQLYPTIAALSDGDFVITWGSNNQVSSTSGYDVYAQRFASNGTVLGSEFLVNTYTTSNQYLPAIAALRNGDFVITWASNNQVSSTSGYDVFARRFASNGTVLGSEFLVNTFTANIQYYPAIAALSNGDFVITWMSTNQVGSTSGSDVYVQRFASNGTVLGSEFLVNTYTVGEQWAPAIAALSNGDFVITWTSNNQVSSASGSDVYVQRFASNGTVLGGEFLVNIYTVNEQTNSAIAALNNGNFMITWMSNNQVSGASYYDVYAQRFASNGAVLDTEFLVNTYTASHQINPAIAALNNGAFVIAWLSTNQVDFSDIYASILITSYELPLLLQNNLVINQGQSLAFEGGNLLANSGGPTAFANLLFLLSDVQHGQFARNQTIQPIFNFTQAELQNGLIRFTHDDSYVAPAYQIAVSDGLNSTAPQVAVIDFYQKPQFVHNQFAIANGKTIKLTNDELLATTDRNNLEIIFDVQNVKYGVFSLNEATISFANAVTNFNQSQINAGQVWFVHDGGNKAPSYSIRATNNGAASSYQLGTITFTPDAAASNKNTIIGAAVGASAAGVLLAGLGIFGGYRYKKAKANAKERARYPLADALFEALKIKSAEDFASSKGIAFVNASNALSDELNKIGIDTSQMLSEELTELSEKLARAIKAHISHEFVWGGIELNPLDIQDHAQAIVHTAQTLGSALLSNANELEMGTISKKNADVNRLAMYLQKRGVDMNVMTPAELNRLADAIAEVAKNSAESSARSMNAY